MATFTCDVMINKGGYADTNTVVTAISAGTDTAAAAVAAATTAAVAATAAAGSM
jgi:hypothetical protein